MKLYYKLEKEFLELIEQYPYNQITYSFDYLPINNQVRCIIWDEKARPSELVTTLHEQAIGYNGIRAPMYKGILMWQQDYYDFENEMSLLVNYAEQAIRFIDHITSELVTVINGDL